MVDQSELSKEAKDKLDEILRKIFDSDFDPLITKIALEESRGCFKGHDELLREWDKLLPKMDAKRLNHMRNTMRLMREKTAEAEAKSYRVWNEIGLWLSQYIPVYSSVYRRFGPPG